ncbi:hypothetical protein [Methylocaldum sp. RMAD-M]|jgi:hypothetical protein|uniref:hypothetical protein n=1 Tax=Methylocaldum sp. RMAD-M TaxID=2806557 RepID=UPI000A31FFEC|nr:hypothetical protein [Methylocaldum sp. RMAD-M]MBP1152828.1 hypothetical protein [Methylocaldum sp. RMAD-M]
MKRNVPTVFERTPNIYPEPRLFIVTETTGSDEDAAHLDSLPLYDHSRAEAGYDPATRHRRIPELCPAMPKDGKAGCL